MRIVIGLVATLILVLVGGVVWYAFSTLQPVDDRTFIAGGGEEGGASVDSQARLRIIGLEGEISALRDEISSLRGEIQSLQRSLSQIGQQQGGGDVDGRVNTIANDYAKTVLIPDRRTLNAGLSVATPSFLEGFLGRPRNTLSDNCEPMTNADLASLLRTESVGPIRVQMLEPAVESLRGVFEQVGQMDGELLNRISTAGSLCVRQIRGSQGRTSTHAFGLAVDLNIDGQLDVFGDGKTQLGLLIMKDFFLAEGWVWGAAYGREDSMHFEVSREKIEAWRAEGRL